MILTMIIVLASYIGPCNGEPKSLVEYAEVYQAGVWMESRDIHCDGELMDWTVTRGGSADIFIKTVPLPVFLGPSPDQIKTTQFIEQVIASDVLENMGRPDTASNRNLVIKHQNSWAAHWGFSSSWLDFVGGYNPFGRTEITGGFDFKSPGFGDTILALEKQEN